VLSAGFFIKEKLMESRNYKLADRALLAVAILSLVVITLFSPGARAQSGNIYSGNQSQMLGTVQEGIVLQAGIKTVSGGNTTNMVGSGVGAALGGLVLGGNQNLDWQARSAAMLLGGVLGGVVGNKVTERISERQAQELVIGLKNPQTGSISTVVTIVQPEPFEALGVNEKVLVLNNGGTFRVIKQSFDSAMVQR
jgi:outer membrane lipoprotein SlyB